MALQPLQPLQQQQFQPPMQQQQYQYQPPAQQQQPQGWMDWIMQKLGGLYQGGKEALFGTPGGWQQLQNYHPHQQQALDQILGGGLQMLQNPYQGWEGLEQEATNRFNQQIIPGLAERFTSMGGHGTAATSSPAFAGQLGAAGAGLSSMLNAQKAYYGQQNRQQGLQQAQIGLTPQFQYGELAPQEGYWPTLAQGATMYATGGLTGAPAASHLINKGVNYLRNRK